VLATRKSLLDGGESLASLYDPEAMPSALLEAHIALDKIEGSRAVPLTPFVAHLLAALSRRNEWAFSSPASASRKLTEPRIAHRQACAAAGLELTLHGLRRSFASLCEWLDIPGGINAQNQGHAPQGVREQNYIHRPLVTCCEFTTKRLKRGFWNRPG